MGIPGSRTQQEEHMILNVPLILNPIYFVFVIIWTPDYGVKLSFEVSK